MGGLIRPLGRRVKPLSDERAEAVCLAHTGSRSLILGQLRNILRARLAENLENGGREVSCPRCGGYSLATEILSEQEPIRAERCVNCGWIGGEVTLDTHHAVDCPPVL